MQKQKQKKNLCAITTCHTTIPSVFECIVIRCGSIRSSSHGNCLREGERWRASSAGERATVYSKPLSLNRSTLLFPNQRLVFLSFTQLPYFTFFFGKKQQRTQFWLIPIVNCAIKWRACFLWFILSNWWVMNALQLYFIEGLHAFEASNIYIFIYLTYWVPSFILGE